MSNISLDSTDSDVFYVEQSSSEPSPRRHNTPNILNSTEMSEHHTTRMPSVSTIASPEPRIFTIDDDSNEPTMPYGFGQQLPIVPPSLNDLNLPTNPFNILATMAIANNTGDDNDGYSPQSPEQSLPSPISTPPMKISTTSGLETPHTTTDDNTLYYSSDNDPRRIYWETSLNETFESILSLEESTSSQALHPHRHHLRESWKERWTWECPFQKRGECRSTSAKPADKRFPQRTLQAHRTESRSLKRLNILLN